MAGYSSESLEFLIYSEQKYRSIALNAKSKKLKKISMELADMVMEEIKELTLAQELAQEQEKSVE